MHVRVSRRLITSLAAGAMGLALVAGTAACSSGGPGITGGGGRSTGGVCSDTALKAKNLFQSMQGQVAALATNPNPSADLQQQATTAVKGVFTNLAQLFRDEAGTASDSHLA